MMLFLATIICSCNKKNGEADEMVEALEMFTKETDIDISDYNSILFIPLEGCGSCIEKGVGFFREYCDDDRILYVMCTHKPFAYEYLKNNDKPNVIVDKRGIAIKNKILSTAPVVYKKDNDKFKCLGTATSSFDYNLLF